MNRLNYACVLVMAMVLVAGCGAATPQQLVTNIAQATAVNDEPAFLACYEFSSPEAREMVAGFFRTIQATDQYQQKFAFVYGVAAAEEYCGGTLRDVIATMTPDECRFVIEGDRALMTHVTGEMEMVRIDGVWRVDYRGFESVTELEQVRAQTKLYGEVAGVYRELIAAMDTPGMTPADIAEMEGLLMQDMYDMSRSHFAAP